MDTNSVLIGVSLELGGIKLIKWLSEIFDIYIPFFVVKNELPGASRDYELDITETRRILHATKVKAIADEYFVSCLNVTKKWLGKSRLDIDKGELSCLGLSLYLSRTLSNFIFLVSDDFRARDEALDKFVDEQKIGMALSSPDIILYAFSRTRTLSSTQTLRAFQDFFAVMKAKKILGKKKEYIMSFFEMCRKAGLDNGLCQQECFATKQIYPMPKY